MHLLCRAPLPRRLHKTLVKQLKYALVWGSSVKHRPQKVGNAAHSHCPRLRMGGCACHAWACMWWQRLASVRTMCGQLCMASIACLCAMPWLTLPAAALGPCLQVGKDHVLQDEDIVQLVRAGTVLPLQGRRTHRCPGLAVRRWAGPSGRNRLLRPADWPGNAAL